MATSAPLPWQDPARIAEFADRFAAMGSEARLRIVRLLLMAHPAGLFVGEIQAELGLTGSNLSHHLDKLKNEGLVNVQREGTFLRCTANTGALREVLDFLYAECCTRSRAIPPEQLPVLPGEPAGSTPCCVAAASPSTAAITQKEDQP